MWLTMGQPHVLVQLCANLAPPITRQGDKNYYIRELVVRLTVYLLALVE